MDLDNLDEDVPQKNMRARSKYNFSKVKPGSSLHVPDNAERCRVMAAFKYWSKQRPERRGAYAVSEKVGDDDPRGPGYRVWFRSSGSDAMRLAAKVEAPSEDI